MTALADSVDITPALGGNIISHMEEPGNRSLLKWKLQVKIMTTRITVVRRFARTYRAKSFQCGIAPGLTAASPQLLSKVKDQGSKTNILSSEALNSRALFSPNTPLQDAPKQKDQLRTSEKKTGEGFSFKMGDFFKDHRTLSTIQLLLTLFTFQILKESDLPEEANQAIGGLIIVTVIFLDSRQEGTTATYNPVGRTVSLKGLLLCLLCLSDFKKIVVNAQYDSDDGKLKCPSEPVDLPSNVQATVWTFVIVMIAFIAGRMNRQPLVPATVAAPLAVPVAAAAPPAVPAAAAAPLAVPAAAAAPLAVPVAAAAPLAVPVAAAALLAVPVPAIGFVNVADVLEENPAAARRSDSVFYIRPEI